MLASELITSVRRRCRIPDGGSVASDAEILGLANEEQRLTLTPLLVSAGSEYWVTYADTSIADGTSDYRIPERAVMGSLRDVLLVDSTGNPQSLDEIPLEESWRYERITSGYSAYSLRLKYVRRPNELIDESDAAKVTTVNTTNSLVASGGVGNVTQEEDADVIEGNPNWDWLDTDNNVAFISGTTITLTDGVSEIAVGDWIAPAGQTPVVQLPTELQDVLVSAVSVRVHELLSDDRAMARAERMLGRYAELARYSMEPRVDGETPRIVNHNSLFIGGGGMSRNRWRYGSDAGLAFTVEGDMVRLLRPGGRSL